MNHPAFPPMRSGIHLSIERNISPETDAEPHRKEAQEHAEEKPIPKTAAPTMCHIVLSATSNSRVSGRRWVNVPYRHANAPAPNR